MLERGMIKVKKEKPSPELYSSAALFYTGAAAQWIRNDVVANGKRTFTFVDEYGLLIDYVFDANAPEGAPSGKDLSTSGRAYLLTATGEVVANVDGNNAVFVELRFPDTSIWRFSLETKKIVSLGNASGQRIEMDDILETARLDIVTAGTVLRQLKAPDGLADIVNLGNAVGFRVNLYGFAQIGDKIDGIYQTNGSPYRTITFENPDPDDPNPKRIKITDVWGSRTREYVFTYQEALDDWTLDRGNGMSTESKQLISPVGVNPRVYQRVLTDSTGNVVAKKHFTLYKTAWGSSILTSETVDPDGLNYTTNYNYNLVVGTVGYGRLLGQTNPDGSWVRYAYDAQGRMSKNITPWLDSPIGVPETAARVVEYLFTPVDPEDTETTNDGRPRTVIERIAGVEAKRTYYAYKTAPNNERVEIEELVPNQGAAYGTPGNLRTTKTYYPANAGLANAGRLKTVQQPDGHLATYHYAINNSSTEDFLVATITEGAIGSSNGIPNKSLRQIITKNIRGLIVSEEVQVFTGSGYDRLYVTRNTYDSEGFLTQTSRDGRVMREAFYQSGLLQMEANEEGVKRFYTYDALGRLASEIKQGIGNQVDVTTTYAHELGGLDCGCDSHTQKTVTAGDLSYIISTKKDQLGRITEQVDQTGAVTTTAYTNGGRTVTTLRPNTATLIREHYLDGQLKSLTGTSVVAQYLTYGVETNGKRWVKSNYGASNGVRWEKVMADLLGRSVRKEKPGFGDNAVLIEEIVYNEQGQLAQKIMRAEGQTATVPEGITYSYNAIQASVGASIARGNLLVRNDLADQTYVKEGATWFLLTTKRYQYDENTVLRTNILEITKEQVNNFSGNIVSYGERFSAPFDENGVSVNKLTQTTTINRAAKVKNIIATHATSNNTKETTQINGFLVAESSSTHGGLTLYSYDALGRKTGKKEARHTNYSTINYNSQGQVSSTTDAAGNSTNFVYYANGTIGAGQIRQAILSNNETIFYEYDLKGNEIYIWGSATYPTVKGYNSLGQQNLSRTFRSTSDVIFKGTSFPATLDGDTTTWTYDEATGLLLTKTYANGKSVNYSYYADGYPKARTWARKDVNGNPIVTTYTYTDQGKLAQIQYSDNTPGVTCAYNALGQQVSISDAAGTRTFAYDHSTLSRNQETHTGIVNGTLTRSYDSYGRATGYLLAENATAATPITAASYVYGNTGRLAQIKANNVPSELASLNVPPAALAAALVFEYAYLNNSDLVESVINASHIVVNSYEVNRDVLLSKQNKTHTGAVVSQYDYATNAVGQRVSRSRSETAFSSNSVDNFTYNSRGEVVNSSNSQTAMNQSFAYDLIGNRVASNDSGNVANYTSNDLNQYLAVATTTETANMTYDDDGNMLTDGRGKSFTWDGENRLVQITLADGSIIRNTYDGGHRRVKREHITGTTTKSTVFFYDRWDVINEKETDSSTGISGSKSYVWNFKKENPIQPHDNTGGLLVLIQPSAETVLTYTYDGNGNVSELLNSLGAIQAHYSYDAFGKGLDVSGPYAHVNHYRFSTKSYDGQSGLYYYGYRFYDPIDGRWISRDRIEERGGINLYSTVENDPINRWDVLGLTCVSVGVETSKTQSEYQFGPIGFEFSLEFKLETKACNKCCAEGTANAGTEITDTSINGEISASMTLSASSFGGGIKIGKYGIKWWAGIKVEGGLSGSGSGELTTDKCNNKGLVGSICISLTGSLTVSGGAGATIKVGWFSLEVEAKISGIVELSLSKCYVCKDDACEWEKTQLCVSGRIEFELNIKFVYVKFIIWDAGSSCVEI